MTLQAPQDSRGGLKSPSEWHLLQQAASIHRVKDSVHSLKSCVLYTHGVTKAKSAEGENRPMSRSKCQVKVRAKEGSLKNERSNLIQVVQQASVHFSRKEKHKEDMTQEMEGRVRTEVSYEPSVPEV